MKDSWQYINYGALFLVFHLDRWALISVSLAPSLGRYTFSVIVRSRGHDAFNGPFTAGLMK